MMFTVTGGTGVVVREAKQDLSYHVVVVVVVLRTQMVKIFMFTAGAGMTGGRLNRFNIVIISSGKTEYTL